MKVRKFYNQLNKDVRLALIIALLVVLWFISGIFNSTQLEKVNKDFKVPKVFAQVSNPFEYTEVVDLVGRTDVAQKVDLVSEISGKVSKIYFKQGDMVKAGDLMLEIENDYIENRLKAAKETLEAKELKLEIAKKLAKQAYKAKTELAEAQANYAKAFSEYIDTKRDYDNSFVNAPITGFVESKSVDVGDYVKDDSFLYKIISQNELLLVGYLSQSQMDKVKLNDKAYGTFTNGQTVEGLVTFISHQGDDKTKTYKLEVTVDAKQQNFEVKAGRTTNIKIPVGKTSVYEVPHSALVIADDGTLGIRTVNKDNVVVFKNAEVIKDTNNSLMVKVDSNKPLRVITRGQLDVTNGMKVKPSFSDDLNTKGDKA